MKKLNNQQQIKVLEETIILLEHQNVYHGICYHLQRAILKIYDIDVEYYELNNYIPLFTYENAANYGDVTENANGLRSWYWWDAYLKNPRIKFINWMINEIKKQE